MICIRPGIVVIRAWALLPPPAVPRDDDPVAANPVDSEEADDVWLVEPEMAPANDAEVVVIEVVVTGATARGATELVVLVRFVVGELVVLVVEPSEELVVPSCFPEVTGDVSVSVAVGC
jgi:hypothetical protein